jgi:hypothetical protein
MACEAGDWRRGDDRKLRALEQEPRPSDSRPLDAAKAGADLGPGAELRRVRLTDWRIVLRLSVQSRSG